MDPHHIDADPDSTYYPDADADADPDTSFHPDADSDPALSLKKAQTIEKVLK